MTEHRVAALYTLALSSPYRGMSYVDPWPIKRDAKTYDGPLPVVAHPPCGPWSRAWSHAVRDRPEQDPRCAPRAVEQVRKWGGILEHPALSRLWDTGADLPLPFAYGTRPELAIRDRWGGFTIEVHLCDFGDPRQKPTWLYMVGVDPERIELPKPREPAPTPDVMRTDGTGRRSAGDFMSEQARKRTTPELARWLVDLAATVERRD